MDNNNCLTNKDNCWILSVQGGDKERPPSCWSVSSEKIVCWSLSLEDICKQNDEPVFTEPIEMEKHGILNIFAVHIHSEEIFMAVKYRDPDDVSEETYLDQFGSATVALADGRYAYYPTYKASEIVRVYDNNGDLPYEEGLTDYGYKYIIRPEKDINFNVVYKMEHGFRLVRGIISSSMSEQRHYMDYVKASVSTSEDLVGDGCLITGYGEFTLQPNLVFTAKNDQSYRLNLQFDGIGLNYLAATGLNYALTETLALTHSSSSAYNIAEDYGIPNVFLNMDPKQNEVYGNSKIVAIMQNDDQTVGFPERGRGDAAFYDFMPNLAYGFTHAYQDGQWTGTGNTGSTVGDDGTHPPSFYTVSISTQRHSSVQPPDSDTETFLGMVSQFTHRIIDNYGVQYGEVPIANRVRLSARQLLLFERDFVVVMQRQVVWLRFDATTWDYTLEPMHPADQMTDMCVWNNQLIIADGSSRLSVKNMLQYD